MASTDTLPRFFKVFISHFSSDSMLIPISYYDELPRHLPKTAILQGTGGCVWKVAMTLKQEEEEVYFEQGWPKFVKDNALVDGDFMTFVYNGDNIFEVSIYGLDGCKETRAVAEVDDDSICALSSDDTDTSVTAQRSNDKGKSKEVAVDDSDDEEESVYSLSNSEDTDKDSSSESEMTSAVLRSKNKGKSKEEEVKEESEDKEDSDHSLNSEDTGSESKMDKTTKKKAGKKKKKESSDSDYAEEFGRLDLEEEDSSSDSSYALDSEEDTATHAKRKVTSPKMKGGSQGKSKVINDVVEVGATSCAVERVPKRREKVKTIIENPEVYLDDPTNIYFETGVKNRKYELLVHAQLVKDYCLRFKDYVCYIDPKGKLEAKTARWKDQRVCIKKWIRICNRNKLKKEDRVVCELLRNKDLVYAVKIHIVRAKYLV